MNRRIWAIVPALAFAPGLALVANQAPATAATRTLIASADSYTRSDAKTSNYGTDPRVFTSGRTNRLRHTVLKFHLPTLPSGQTITGATLRLYAQAASRGSGADVYTTSTGWTETGVTWNTEPAHGTLLVKNGE